MTTVPVDEPPSDRAPDPFPDEVTQNDPGSAVVSTIVDGDFLANTDLTDRLDSLAQQPNLLIACDYDGTLAPIVSDLMKALPLREASVALRSLAALPQTEVAVISGRSLRDLAALSRLPAEIHLVGSHGTEFDIDFALDLDPALREKRTTVISALHILADTYTGMTLEKKPASVAVHYRNVDDSVTDELPA